MAINLAIHEDLLSVAQKAGGHKTPKDTVTESLKEYIHRWKQRKQMEIV